MYKIEQSSTAGVEAKEHVKRHSSRVGVRKALAMLKGEAIKSGSGKARIKQSKEDIRQTKEEISQAQDKTEVTFFEEQLKTVRDNDSLTIILEGANTTLSRITSTKEKARLAESMLASMPDNTSSSQLQEGTSPALQSIKRKASDIVDKQQEAEADLKDQLKAETDQRATEAEAHRKAADKLAAAKRAEADKLAAEEAARLKAQQNADQLAADQREEVRRKAAEQRAAETVRREREEAVLLKQRRQRFAQFLLDNKKPDLEALATAIIETPGNIRHRLKGQYTHLKHAVVTIKYLEQQTKDTKYATGCTHMIARLKNIVNPALLTLGTTVDVVSPNDQILTSPGVAATWKSAEKAWDSYFRAKKPQNAISNITAIIAEGVALQLK